MLRQEHADAFVSRECHEERFHTFSRQEENIFQSVLQRQLQSCSKMLWIQDELKEAQDNWLPQLLDKVKKVSQAFSENFARIGSVGEVALHQDGEKYESYAIHIKVKFRNEGALEVRHPYLLIRLQLTWQGTADLCIF